MNIKQFSRFLNDNNNDYQFIFYDNKIKEKDKRFKIVRANMINIKEKK